MLNIMIGKLINVVGVSGNYLFNYDFVVREGHACLCSDDNYIMKTDMTHNFEI